MSSLQLSYTGSCPKCKKVLAFNSVSSIIECPSCNHRSLSNDLVNFNKLGNSFLTYYNLLRSELTAQKSSGPAKIDGLSSYECKLLGPHLTTHGVDKAGNPKPLRTLQPSGAEFFDAFALGDRAFAIEKQHLDKIGYGVDKYSLQYLSELLHFVDEANNKEQCLVPLHVDGDGHCLVHAISRCLVGRELFWHALRMSIYVHMKDNRDRYEAVYAGFVDSSGDEWDKIIAEAHPDYRPPLDSLDGHGLCVIHIFALANVLRRPIFLLDGMDGMRSKCEYTGVYLPSLYPPEECCGKTKEGVTPELNKPIAVAWSSSGHNHYVPLVAVQGASPVKFPSHLLPEVSISQPEDFRRYVKVEPDGSVILGGGKSLSNVFITKLTNAMGVLFHRDHKVSSTVVADGYFYLFQQAGAVHVAASDVVEIIRQAVVDKRLFRCLSCKSLTMEEAGKELEERDMKPGGLLHLYAKDSQIDPKDGLLYRFPSLNIRARYEESTNRFLPVSKDRVECASCSQILVRPMNADGTLEYQEGDRTLTPVTSGRKTNCNCGFKHYYGGHEYDNVPLRFSLVLDWNETRVPVEIYWFDKEENPALNSNAYKLAAELVNKHYPADFGSERLTQRLVEQIFKKVDANDKLTKVKELDSQPSVASTDPMHELGPMKTIFTGPSKTTFHKEELGMSKAEKDLQKRISKNATGAQKKLTSHGKDSKDSPSKPAFVAKTHPSSASSVSPGTANVSSPPPEKSPGRPIRVRVSMQGGNTADLEFIPPVMAEILRAAIADKLDVPWQCQRLRYGFPPRELKLVDGEEVPLQHGDKLSLEDVRRALGAAAQPSPQASLAAYFSTNPSSASSGFSSVSSGVSSAAYPSSMQPSLSTLSASRSDYPSALASSASSLSNNVMRLLKDLEGDCFNEYRDQPEVFERQGTLMTLIKGSHPHLRDGEHITIPMMPSKTFMYNMAADRLELCLGLYHKAMADITPGDLRLAEQLAATDPALSGAASASGSAASCSSSRLAAGGSGVVSSAVADRSHTAFTGHGHRMTAAPPPQTGNPSSHSLLQSRLNTSTAPASLTSTNIPMNHLTSGMSPLAPSSLGAAATSPSLGLASSTARTRRHQHRISPASEKGACSNDDSSDDTAPSEGSDGEEVSYKDEKPKKRQCKPSSLKIDALAQRVAQLSGQEAALLAKLARSEQSLDPPKEDQLRKQLEQVQQDLELVQAERDELLLAERDSTPSPD